MAFNLTVAGSLEPLADALADVLSDPLPETDPFAPELVIIPGLGVRTWLNSRLSERLGSTGGRPDGIVANITYAFPGEILARAFGPDSGLGQWSTGPLTWAVFDELVAHGDVHQQPADAVRARAIADLFDRYTLYRQSMVLGWGRGSDELGRGREVGDHQRWQPALWRAVRERTGSTTDAERMRTLMRDLHAGLVPDTVPDRIIVFGLASLPPPHLEVLGALGRICDVHVFAPTPSGERWQQVVSRLPAELELPIPRDDPTFPDVVGNPLITNWGRTAREAHGLLYVTARGAGAVPVTSFEVPPLDADATVLQRIQHDLMTDSIAPGVPLRGADPASDTRALLGAQDTSIRWHRCYGHARQVEVARDAILHLLSEQRDGVPVYQPRDIAILTPDIARFAPLVDATFAGDVAHGVPAIPLEVADRSLRQDNQLVDALVQLFDLTERRFRASDLLRFISTLPVQRRFGLDADAINRISQWVDDTNIRWGLTASDLEQFDVSPELDAFTWSSGVERLLLGAALPDGPARLGLGDVPPQPGIEGADVAIAGQLAELLHRLSFVIERLGASTSVHDWCDTVADSISRLFALDDDTAWLARSVEFALEDLETDAAADGEPVEREVDPSELAALLRARLESGSSRPRFGTGSVTLSSLTAQRGIPYKVVCILGLDAEASAVTSAEDLVAANPCIGDRDARSEQRAQLLDAVLAAGDRLLILSNGHDLKSNAVLSPAVPLAEFLDVVDATVVGPSGRSASQCLAVDHPRQGWSDRAFIPGELGIDGPWGFDSGARDAAIARRVQIEAPAFLDRGLALPQVPAGEIARVSVDDLITAVATPVEFFLRRRLGLVTRGEAVTVPDDIPLEIDHLEQWGLVNDLLTARIENFRSWTAADTAAWADVARRRGDVPPGSLAAPVLTAASVRADGIVRLLSSELTDTTFDPIGIPIRAVIEPTGAPEVLVEGTIGGACANTLVRVTPSRLKVTDIIGAWIKLALVTRTDPDRAWRSISIGRASAGEGLGVQRLRLVSAAAADDICDFAIDMWRRAQVDVLPVFPATSRALHADDATAAAKAWNTPYNGRGERDDEWNAMVFDVDFDELLTIRPSPAESGGSSLPRVSWWADRLWTQIESTCSIEVLDTDDGPEVDR